MFFSQLFQMSNRKTPVGVWFFDSATASKIRTLILAFIFTYFMYLFVVFVRLWLSNSLRSTVFRIILLLYREIFTRLFSYFCKMDFQNLTSGLWAVFGVWFWCEYFFSLSLRFQFVGNSLRSSVLSGSFYY